MKNIERSETVEKEIDNEKNKKETSFKNLTDNFLEDVVQSIKKKKSKQHNIIKRNPKLNYNRGVTKQ